MNPRMIFLAASFALIATPVWADAASDMMAADKAFSDMSVAKGAHAAFLAFMADDVRIFQGDHPPIVGRKAVEDFYAANPDEPSEKLLWTPVEADASPDGALGFTRGTWIYTAPKPDGSEVKVTGYYVTEWKKQADGQYKFTLDIGGADKQ
jgi:ketosteroid isomerase-like protein